MLVEEAVSDENNCILGLVDQQHQSADAGVDCEQQGIQAMAQAAAAADMQLEGDRAWRMTSKLQDLTSEPWTSLSRNE